MYMGFFSYGFFLMVLLKVFPMVQIQIVLLCEMPFDTTLANPFCAVKCFPLPTNHQRKPLAKFPKKIYTKGPKNRLYLCCFFCVKTLAKVLCKTLTKRPLLEGRIEGHFTKHLSVGPFEKGSSYKPQLKVLYKKAAP